jgi:murein DD-endopeptidase MepM/ murein hydrolase activator NlpD
VGLRLPLLKARLVTALLAVALPGALLEAQSAYRYRDANGQWVFSDRTVGTRAADALALEHAREALHIGVERADTEAATELIAANDCLCVATLRITILESDFAQIAKGGSYQATLAPGERHTLLRAPRPGSGQGELQFTVATALGSPKAVHSPTHPYRAPFALGATFTVSQAYPTRITHVTPDSQYAVDFAMPDGTPVYAAREGTVINVRHDSFRGAPAPAMLDQANFILILHADGTIGVYGHLQWDSIRVRIGQQVVRGEYIANSGNTGFTTGPHLHFAVWRNTGTGDVSIPVQFAGVGGVAVTAATSVPLTAY